MNYFKTALLLAGLTGLFLAIGYTIAGQGGMLIAFLIAAAMNVFSWWNSDKMVLRMHNAQQIDEQSAPEFFDIVRQLSTHAGLPMPRVFIIHEDQPNAFATGRNPENAAVAATSGLLERMSKEEIAGVMAHELAHIKNHDTLIMTVTASIAGAVSMLANIAMFTGGNRNSGGMGIIGNLALLILAPMGAAVVQMAISRTREYAADRMGAEICGRPMWLASALTNMQNAAERIENQHAEDAPATAHMFIINPLSGARMDKLFSTHPDTENRVAALQKLADDWGTPGASAAGAAGRKSAQIADHGGPEGRGPWGPGESGGGAGPWD